MSTPSFPPRTNRILTGIAVSLVLHLLLIWGWRVAMRVPARPDPRRAAMDWIEVRLARPAPLKAPATPAMPKAGRQAHGGAPRVPQQSAPQVPPIAAPPPTPVITTDPLTLAPATPAQEDTAKPSAEAMLEQAKRDIRKFDKELRREFAPRGFSKPVTSPQIRLAQGIEDAYDAVPPKWYESAKIKEIIDPGQYGRKRYRITTAFGTYCMTYESPNSPTSQLDIGKRVEPKMTNCPAHEAPATEQK